jgi:hypothetical protein
MNQVKILLLAIKYWARGGDWKSGLEYAQMLIEGFQKKERLNDK